MRKIISLSVMLSLVLLSGCRSSAETVNIRIGNTTFRIEIARTMEEQRKGLMERESIDADTGMIFVYNEDRKLSFWMKNTLVPLSIAYIAKDGTIREIYEMEPESLKPVDSMYSVRYALELPSGAFERAGVKPGDKIELPENLSSR